MHTHRIPLENIYSDIDISIRENVTPLTVLELAKSIKKFGLLQPITVQKCPGAKADYRIILGYRRMKALEVLQESSVFCFLLPEVFDDSRIIELCLSENLTNKSFNILEEARALKRFQDQCFSIADIVKKTERTPGWVYRRFTLLKLPLGVQKEFACGLRSEDQILEIARQLN